MYSAMKANQKVKANILRSLLAVLKKVEIETKNPLSEDQFLVVVKKMVKQLKESIEVYSKAGRMELAEKEKSELEIIQVYLPEQLSEEKTIELVENYEKLKNLELQNKEDKIIKNKEKKTYKKTYKKKRFYKKPK